MPASSFRPKVFVSYSHRDRELKEKFDDNLKVLKVQGIIDFWTDGEIQPGDFWAEEITKAMNEANLILFLVSNHFLSSSFIREKEAPMAMARQTKGQAVIIPIILRKTPGWQNEAWSMLQALPSQVKPVDHPDWRSPENAFAEVEARLRELIEDLPQKLAQQAAPRQAVPTLQSDATVFNQPTKHTHSKPALTFSRLRWVGFAALLLIILGSFIWLTRSNVPEEPPSPFQKRVEVGGIVFELVKATGSSSGLKFEVLAASTNTNTEVWVSFATTLTDRQGRPHRVSSRRSGSNSSGGDVLAVPLSAGIPTRIELGFATAANVDAFPVPILSLMTWHQGKIDFRSIPEMP